MARPWVPSCGGSRRHSTTRSSGWSSTSATRRRPWCAHAPRATLAPAPHAYTRSQTDPPRCSSPSQGKSIDTSPSTEDLEQTLVRKAPLPTPPPHPPPTHPNAHPSDAHVARFLGGSRSDDRDTLACHVCIHRVGTGGWRHNCNLLICVLPKTRAVPNRFDAASN